VHQILDTGIKNAKNVPNYIYGAGSLESVNSILLERRQAETDYAVYFVDTYFSGQHHLLEACPTFPVDCLFFVDTTNEPTTDYINKLTNEIIQNEKGCPYAIIGIGGGSTMDVAKAVSNLLTNGGRAEDYQGWDLVKVPGVFKIGVPTISGTGAEATRTCVMTNKKSGLKLGMNSNFTVFDQLILDPDLSRTVPDNQYFYTGMDAYIHCVESLAGSYRNAVGDAFSEQSLNLCRQVFFKPDMKSDESRSKLMVASYLGGCAVATSYVGVVHPFSAGLSVVLGIHHGLANCIAMVAMEEFYPQQVEEFWRMVEVQKIDIPRGLCKNLTPEEYGQLYQSTIIHEKPLTNALGENFKSILTPQKTEEIFRRM
jgi:3-deoxy-alpha-D-manno-octulosonate 8-oxidase